jgi:hypothetical protein
MLSDPADKLLAALKIVPGGKLCVVCAGERLQMDRDGTLKAMRELVANGYIIHGQFHCSACRGVALVAFLRPFSFPPLDA